LKVVLKEIRESLVNLKIIIRKPLLVDPHVDLALKEAGELMAIFLKSIQTAQFNLKNKK
jgi:hypothetical protein